MGSILRLLPKETEDMQIRFTKRTIARLREELKTAQRLSNLRLFKITKTILLIADGEAMKTVADLFAVSPKTVYNWFCRFLAERFSWLVGHHYRGRGRKSKLNKEQKQRLYDLICSGPEKCGFDCGIWTSGMIAELVLQKFNVMYSPRYLCQLLKQMKLSYQKAAFESDHLDEEKRREWREVTWPAILKQAEEKKAIILFGDEVSFAQWGSLSRTWAPRGKQPKIKTTGKRKGMKVFGVIGFFNGDFHYMETPDKFNAQTYVQFLDTVVGQCKCPVILIEDGAKYHNGPDARNFKERMESEGKLFVHRLPSYSPDYNPIEKLWRKTKRDATHCKYFPTFDDLRNAVMNAFEKYMRDATKVIGVMKKLREQAGLSAA
jgi:transposase